MERRARFGNRWGLLGVAAVVLAVLLAWSGAAMAQEITFWVIDSFTRSPDAPIYQAIRQFEQANPGIRVVVEPAPANAIHDRIVTSIIGGEGPDVVALDIAWAGEFIALGLLQDLTPQVAPIADQYFDGPMAALQENGRYYAVPWYTNNVALYYNKDMFAAAGIERPPATWEEFYEAARKLKEAGYYALSLARGGFGTYFFISFLYQNGGRIFAEDGRTLVFNSPEAVEAFEWFTGLYTDLKAVPDTIMSAFSWDEVYAPFLQGRAAMFISGDWARFTIQQNAPHINWGVAPLPAGKRRATVAGGYNLAIGANSRNREAAWKLIEYLTGPEGEGMLLEYGRIPARKDILTSEAASRDPFFALFIEQAEYGVPQPTHPAWLRLNNIIGDAFDAVIQGLKTPKQALDDAVREGQALVNSL